jgi:beta-lactamase class A
MNTRAAASPLTRRVLIGTVLTAPMLSRAAAQTSPDALRAQIALCEKNSGGRLGVAVLDSATGARFAWRGDERFAMCSTFKFLLATAILQRVDRGQESLARTIPVHASDLLDPTPTAGRFAGRAAPIGVLLQGMIEFSDNTAANLLLASLGGPPALTAALRAMGDPVTRLDRNEPTLNEAAPGDPRDTTSPNAMLQDLRNIALGNTLSATSRQRLLGWMRDCQTGLERLRAGLPANWVAGDKTGTSGRGTSNDLAIIWPPTRPPILLTCYLTQSKLDQPGQNAILANVARAIAGAIPLHA